MSKARHSRSGFLALLSATSAAVAVLILPATARADRIRIRAEGGIHVRAEGRLHIHYYPRPDFYPYYYPYCPHHYWHFLYGAPPPTLHECGSGSAVVAAVPEREPPILGLGGFGGAVRVEGNDAGSDLGLVARLRLSRHVQVEAELSRTDLGDGAPVDRRLGGALVVQLLPASPLSPYLVGGGGFARADLDDGKLTANQPYGELGVGAELALGRHISLFGDLRAGLRRRDEGDDRAALLVRDTGDDTGGDDDERFSRARVGALLYF